MTSLNKNIFIFLPFLIVSSIFFIDNAAIKAKSSKKHLASAYPASSLGFKFLGFISGNKLEKRAGVVLIKKAKDSSVRAFKVGKLFLDKYTLLEVRNKSILLKENKQEKKIWVHQRFSFGDELESTSTHLTDLKPRKIFKKDSYIEDGFVRNKNKVVMTNEYKKKVLKSIPKILMQAAVEPVSEKGEIIGFLIDLIEEESIFYKIGLENEDIITSINGIKLRSASSAIQLLQSLKNFEELEVELKRNGQDLKLDLSIK